MVEVRWGHKYVLLLSFVTFGGVLGQVFVLLEPALGA